MFSTSFEQFLSQKCQKWAKLSFETSIFTADRVSLLWKNQHLHIFSQFFSVKWLVFWNFTWLSQFLSTIEDTSQVSRLKSAKIKIFKLSYLKFHHFGQFYQLFSLFLPYIMKFPLISMIGLLQKHEFFNFQQFLFPKSQKQRNLTLKNLNFGQFWSYFSWFAENIPSSAKCCLCSNSCSFTNFHKSYDKSTMSFLVYEYTMIQKLSKCEVKVWLCWNLIIWPPLRF